MNETTVTQDTEQVAVHNPTPAPQPKWVWSPDQQFTISGKTFEQLVNFTNVYLSQSAAQEVLAIYELHLQIQQVFQEGVETGAIVDQNKAKAE